MNGMVRRRLFPGIVLLVGIMAMALSCGGSAEQATSPAVGDAMPAAQSAAPAAPQAAATAAPQAMTESAVSKESGGFQRPAQPAAPAADSDATAMSGAAGSPESGESDSLQRQAGRQLIVEGWVSLEVNNIDAAARQVETIAAQRDGWVESSDIIGEGGYRTASINIRIPSERFNSTMDTLRGMGRVTDEGVSSTDVTDRLIDNEARLEAWETQEERLIVLLENAATVEDVIDIERRISEVRADIEQVAATQRNLENRVAATLIRVNLHLPPRFAADPPSGRLTLSVGDPAGIADTISRQVEGLQGYIGEKREYQEGRGNVVELTAYVRPGDLADLMSYAGSLGEPSERQLDSVGPAPVGETPTARLRLMIRSNVDSAASLSLSASEPIIVAAEIRAHAESLGGYVESWNESRYEGDDHENVHMELVVRASDLRGIMEFAAARGETQHWEFQSVGQGPTDAAPNSRFTVSVYTGGDDDLVWLYVLVIVVGVVALAGIVLAAVFISRRRRSASTEPPATVATPESE